MITQFFDEIPIDVFTNFKQIGSGSFSSIFSAIHIPTNTKVALKITIKSDDQNQKKFNNQELSILKSVNHPFICKYFTDFETDHLFIVVMELIEGTNLLQYVNQNHGLKINEVQNIFSQLIIAIEYLHNELNISHRDLKLENVMLDEFNHIRLIDFGFSSTKNIMSTLCGSIPYCAPEVLKCQTYTKEADIWCLGVILYSLVSGKLPFFCSNLNQLVNMICNQEPAYSNIFNPPVRDLISRLLIKDPRHRVSIDEIKSHIFMSHVRILQIDYKSLFSPSSSPHNSNRRRRNTNLKPSQSDPNMFNSFTDSINFDSPRQRRVNSLNSIFANHVTMSNLHKDVTSNADNVDDLIKSRRDHPQKLNKLIESALVICSQNELEINSSHIKLRSSLPSHFRTTTNIFSRRICQNQTFSTQSPLIVKPM